MLCALYNGHVHVMNYENQQLFKDFEVCVDVFCGSIVICCLFELFINITIYSIHCICLLGM